MVPPQSPTLWFHPRVPPHGPIPWSGPTQGLGPTFPVCQFTLAFEFSPKLQLKYSVFVTLSFYIKSGPLNHRELLFKSYNGM